MDIILLNFGCTAIVKNTILLFNSFPHSKPLRIPLLTPIIPYYRIVPLHPEIVNQMYIITIIAFFHFLCVVCVITVWSNITVSTFFNNILFDEKVNLVSASKSSKLYIQNSFQKRREKRHKH